MLSKYFVQILYVLMVLPVCAQGPYNINVGLEYTPGLLQKDGKGKLDLALRDIEKKSNVFHFTIIYMSYLRAKLELKKGHIDMIGLTPKGYESNDFYKYARELDWTLDTNLVLFCNSRRELDLNHGEKVGTPKGNEEFVAEIMKMKESRFETGPLDSLVKRLKKRRISCVAFEEFSTLKLAKVNNIKRLYFRIIGEVRGSFAFRKNFEHSRIVAKFDRGIRELNLKKYMKDLRKIPEGKKNGEIEP